MINIKDFNSKIDTVKKVNDKLFNMELHDNDNFKNIVFVYTPPKVGSTSLVSSIRLSASHKFRVIHLHDDIMLNYLSGYSDVTINDLIYYNSIINKKVFVIDIYRTPIERKISEFFEKISQYHFNNSEENLINYNIDKIIKRFNCVFPHLGKGDHYYDKYNINIAEFDFDKKYIHNVINNINYIKLRLCDSKEWGKILTKLLDTEIIMIYDYKTNDKIIGPLYNNFKMNYKLPINYFYTLKDDKYLDLYYSKEEKNKYLNEWINKLDKNKFIPFTNEEYSFYVKLYLENQYYCDIDLNHYIDNGCLCNLCCKKRNELLEKTKRGIEINEKIIHNQVINDYKNDIINDINTKAANLLKNSKTNNDTSNINVKDLGVTFNYNNTQNMKIQKNLSYLFDYERKKGNSSNFKMHKNITNINNNNKITQPKVFKNVLNSKLNNFNKITFLK